MNLLKLMSLMFLLLLASCAKDNFDTTTIEEEMTSPENITDPNGLLKRADASDGNQSLDLGCVEIPFPFTLVDNEDNEYPIQNIEEYESILSVDSSEVTYIVDFKYPLFVIIVDSEESITVQDGLELGELFSTCIPDQGWDETMFPAYLLNSNNSCYDLSYPLLLENEAGEQVSVASEIEFIDKLASEYLLFVYPFDIIDESGEIIVVSNTSNFFNLLFSCNDLAIDSTWDWESDFDFIGCYSFEFPIKVEVNGEIIEVQNHMEFCDLLLAGNISDYGYPLNLFDIEQNEFVVNSSEELNLALEECYSDSTYFVDNFDFSLLYLGTIGSAEFDTTAMETCLSVVYPITIYFIDQNGTVQTVDINSDEEMDIEAYSYYSIEYPIDLIRIEDQVQLTINDAIELIEIVEQCFIQ